jgi:DNA-binding CsgD family transcriptional regulator
VFINMDPQNLERYSSYYQFHNPISAKAQRFRRAIRVNEIVPQRELVRTEFFNDFLLADGLYYGLNLYVHEGDENVGDMRVWRSSRRENFEDSDLQILEIIKPHFCNAMRNTVRIGREYSKLSSGVERLEPAPSIEWLRAARGLTFREAQIALEIAQGRTDQEIAVSIGVAFSTVRTHIRRVYEKLGVHNRTSLAHLIHASS